MELIDKRRSQIKSAHVASFCLSVLKVQGPLFSVTSDLSRQNIGTAMYAESVFQYLKLTYWYDTNVIPWKYFEFVIGGENLEKQYPTFA